MKKSNILKYSFPVDTYDWDLFLKRVVKEKGVKAVEAKDEEGQYHDLVYLKNKKEVIAKYYHKEFEYMVYTDLTKKDFFMYVRGYNINIVESINDAILEAKSHVITIKNENGIDLPYLVAESRSEAIKIAENYENSNVFEFDATKTYYQNEAYRNVNGYELLDMLESAKDRKRFVAKKMSGVKVQAYNTKGEKIGYYEPKGFGVFDTHRNEFVIIDIFDDSEKYKPEHALNAWKTKKVAQEVADDFNTHGKLGTGESFETLRLIERFKEDK
ncbi:hypothetical protein BPT24_127 [Tenacibaculum phage pT24]|uniref:Uncharacterized protein n=1 Tax=Tenacibaculum phage pT24 TaxID=1880590 RepID=A0A1B4XWQ8_9CAUD|nr:hypothetical protein HYP10_gp127 [Tenacibaculum phage pT24]BAV39252.1 hypothetical protein BPT24_127 [Tenacibaculum phage pT24]